MPQSPRGASRGDWPSVAALSVKLYPSGYVSVSGTAVMLSLSGGWLWRVSRMYYAADRQTAQRALIELRMARLGARAETLAALQRVRNEVACERTDDVARMQAW